MFKDYDLVIIGDTPIGRYTALNAINLKFRVALVEQSFKRSIDIDNDEIIFRQRWYYLSRYLRQTKTFKEWELIKVSSHFLESSLSQWLFNFENISLQKLSELGVNIIQESGKFEHKKFTYFITETQSLISENYLIATGSSYSDSNIQGLTEVGYLDFIEASKKLDQLPKNIAIIAETPIGIEFAQLLNRLGKKITLIIEDFCLLPSEEREIIRYFQAQLEAEGIQLLINSPVTHVKKIDQEKWLEIKGHAIAVDELIITSFPQPNLEGLNLSEIGIKYDKNGIKVNQKRQTSLPNIYAVGGVTGDYYDNNFIQSEAQTILNNILTFPLFKVKNLPQSLVILTDPSYIKLGLTEQQAKEKYGHKIIILDLDFQELPQSQLFNEMTGKLKLITHHNGQILGAHLFSYSAEEYSNIVFLAIQQKIPLPKLAQSSLTSVSFSSIVSQVALQWSQERLKQWVKLPKLIQVGLIKYYLGL